MLNKIMLIGYLGQEPELRSTPNGTPYARFSVATTEKWRAQDGQMQSQTEWHRVIAWNKLGEICGQYLHKGSKVYIEGKSQTRSWEDDAGIKRYSTQVVVREMKMLDSRRDSAEQYEEDYAHDQQQSFSSGVDEEEMPF